MIIPSDSKADDVPTRPNTPMPDDPINSLVSALIGLGIDLRPIVNGTYDMLFLAVRQWALNISYF